MFSVTQFGKPLDPKLYKWDSEKKTFSTEESNLVLDFSNLHGVTFKTGNNCTFNTSHKCTFETGFGCVFDTSYGCTFETGKECICVRRGEICEIIEIPENTKIRLNDYFVKGYKLYSKYLADYLMREEGK
jgi:hypothetical protein